MATETWIIKTEGATEAVTALITLFDGQITNFTSNSVHYNTTSQESAGFGPFRYNSYKYDDTEVATANSFFPTHPTLDVFTWNDESYRTIILDAPASGDLLENLLLCADKQGGGGVARCLM